MFTLATGILKLRPGHLLQLCLDAPFSGRFVPWLFQQDPSSPAGVSDLIDEEWMVLRKQP